MTNNKIRNIKTSGIFRSAIAIPISAIDKIAPREYRTKIHLILPKMITSKINDKKYYYFSFTCDIITQLWTRKKNMEWKYDKYTSRFTKHCNYSTR